MWRYGSHDEGELLARCYASVLAEADRVGAQSVAIFAISTGIYRYPRAEAAQVAVQSIRRAETSVLEVILVAYDVAGLLAYQ